MKSGMVVLSALLVIGCSGERGTAKKKSKAPRTSKTPKTPTRKTPKPPVAKTKQPPDPRPKVPGFTWLREETFSAGGRTHTLQVYRCEAFAKRLGLEAKKTHLSCEFVLIPGGSVRLGSPPKEKDRYANESHRTVRIERFLLARTEVTQRVYGRIMDKNPSKWSSRGMYSADERPVDNVSWNDAQAFCERAGLRLPTEAEWEAACRAGTETPYAFGMSLTAKQAWFDRAGLDGKREGTADVATFASNAYGLFDTHGNVWEWCRDEALFASQGVEGEIDPSDAERVRRGGGWRNTPNFCRSAFRGRDHPDLALDSHGVRPAASIPNEE